MQNRTFVASLSQLYSEHYDRGMWISAAHMEDGSENPILVENIGDIQHCKLDNKHFCYGRFLNSIFIILRINYLNDDEALPLKPCKLLQDSPVFE